jgi:hypothetical protein
LDYDIESHAKKVNVLRLKTFLTEVGEFHNMAIFRASLDSIPISFASVSVGTPGDSLPIKVKAISTAGFQAIELGFS